MLGWPEVEGRDIDPGVFTMQETTLAQDQLSLCQITADSDGGDLFIAPDGRVTFREHGWMTEGEPDWLLGGPGLDAIPVDGVRPSWSMQRIVNEAAFAATGSTQQVASDSASIQFFGRRTTRRLDLINDNDSDVLQLADQTVAALKDDKLVIDEATVLVQDAVSADFATKVKYGDLVAISVDTIHGWSTTYVTHVVGIGAAVTAAGYLVTLTLDDALVVNENGSFARSEFDSSFHLGG